MEPTPTLAQDARNRHATVRLHDWVRRSSMTDSSGPSASRMDQRLALFGYDDYEVRLSTGRCMVPAFAVARALVEWLILGAEHTGRVHGGEAGADAQVGGGRGAPASDRGQVGCLELALCQLRPGWLHACVLLELMGSRTV